MCGSIPVLKPKPFFINGKIHELFIYNFSQAANFLLFNNSYTFFRKGSRF